MKNIGKTTCANISPSPPPSIHADEFHEFFHLHIALTTNMSNARKPFYKYMSLEFPDTHKHIKLQKTKACLNTFIRSSSFDKNSLHFARLSRLHGKPYLKMHKYFIYI